MPGTENKVGIDVSSALASLSKLRVSFDDTGKTIKNFAGATKKEFNISGALKKIDQDAKKAKEALAKLAKEGTKAGKALQVAGKKGAQAGKSMTLSWQTMARVIQTQVIVRALNAIKNAFIASVDEARKFGLSIAEIQTIANNAFGSNSRLAGSVKTLADELGRTSQEVAEGLYQTLSNQVVEASRAFQFLATAQKLATITASSTADAVGAISSVMNSYGEAAGSAAETSDILFKAVELGRLRLADIANVLGRVTPLTAELGISFKEVAATLVVMTKQGTKADTALTQIRAITQKLLKPTEKMTELYKKWGVRDGKQAIKTFGGLRGVLNKVWQETGKNAAEMAKYFNRVRAAVGVLSALNKDGKELEDTMRKMAEATNAAEEAWKEFTKSEAHQLTASINRLKNSLVTFGTTILPIVNIFVVGFNKIFETLGNFFDGVDSRVDVFNAKLEVDLKRANEIYEEALAEWPSITAEEIDKVLAEEYRLLAEGNIIWDQHTAHIETTMSALSDSVKSALEDMFDTGAIGDTVRDAAAGFDKVSEGLDKALKANKKESGESKGRGAINNSLSLSRDFNKAVSELAAFEGKIFTADHLKASQEAAKHAKELAKLGIESAKTSGKTWKMANAEARYQKVLKTEKGVLETSKKMHLQRQDAIKKANDELTKAEDRRKASIPALTKLFENLADAETPEQFAQIKSKIAKELQEGDKQIQKWLDKNKALLDDMGLGKLADEYQSVTQEKLESMSIDWSKQVKQMQEAFNNADLIVKATIDPTGEKTEATEGVLGREKGLKESSSDFLSEGIDAAKEIVIANDLRESQLEAQQKVVEHLKGPLKSAYQELGATVREVYQNQTNSPSELLAQVDVMRNRTISIAELTSKYGENLESTRPKLAAYIEQLKSVSETLLAGKELTDNQTASMEGAKTAYESSTEVVTGTKEALEGVTLAVKTADAALKKVENKKIEPIDEKALANAKALLFSVLSEAEKTKNAMEGTNTAITSATTNLPAMATATGGVATATGTVEKAWDGVISKIGAAAAAAVKAIAQIAAATAAATAAKAAASKRHGGPQYLASGGLGQDSVPAMLSPGEFVINSDSSKKFFSELSSMNNGSQPVYREQGGSVTTVGDVNVTVNGGDSSQQTVREIGYALRREMRRGTIKL
jgi:TP901 family phage tail tape measure protein